MKKPKSIFLVIYFLFHLALLIISIYVNYRSEDFEFLLWLRSKMALMVYVSAAGMLLYFITLMFIGMESRSHKKEKAVLEQEINSLKAKMFDLQEATGKAKAAPTTTTTTPTTPPLDTDTKTDERSEGDNHN